LKKLVLPFVLVFLICHVPAMAKTGKELFDNGVRLFKQGQYQKAIDEFSALIKLDPENADAYKNRGVSYMKLKKFDMAIKDFQKAEKIFPELKGLYSNLGVAWYYKKNYEKAIENYDTAISMNPGNYVAYFNRALCLAELDRTDRALEDLDKTLELNPDFYWAICYKADLLNLTGKNDRAASLYEKAAALKPENGYALDRLNEIRHKAAARDKSVPAQSPDKKFYSLQAGAFLHRQNAFRMKTMLAGQGFDAKILILKDNKNRTWYLVRSGKFSNRSEAEKAAASMKKKSEARPVIRPFNSW
jgi:tetratricopeptide (TPR) repeat protein